MLVSKNSSTARRSKPLPRSFYERATAEVARDLLGRTLCRRLEDGTVLKGRIVETEAYEGVGDRACHAYGGLRTNRTEPLWGDGGHAYVYLIYGMYDCLNAVTREAGRPEAVLIRAAEPLQGHEFFRERLPHLKERDWMRGPGRLCRAMAITRALNKADLRGDELWIEKGDEPASVGVSVRIGVDYAGPCAKKALRFFVKGSPSVSGPKALNEPVKSRAPKRPARSRK